jgi:hypothetical protein
MGFTWDDGGECPKCGNKSFTSAANPSDRAPVTCVRCLHVATVKEAVDALKEAEFLPKPLPKVER